MKVRVVETDSNYIVFKEFDDKPAHELWDFCLEVEKNINRIFPKPIKLLFEEAIYSRYFILSKKRYMCLKMDRDGNIKDDIETRGVLLTRRDNANVIRNIYSNIMMMIFNDKEGIKKNEILDYVVEEMNNMSCYKFPMIDYIVTKKVGNKKNYAVRELPQDEKKREKRFKDLGIKPPCICGFPCKSECFKECKACDEYLIRALPAHIQLAEKIRNRGKVVQVGSRMSYITCRPDLPKSSQFDKIEDPEYQEKFPSYVKLDPLYYIKSMITPFDEMLEIAYGTDKFVKNQHKLRLTKWKMLEELKDEFNNDFNK